MPNAESLKYVFMSFADMHTGKNIGCCIVQVEKFNDANKECDRLGLIPKVDNHARGYLLNDDDFPAQGMDLNRFYSREEMMDMNFKKTTTQVIV